MGGRGGSSNLARDAGGHPENPMGGYASITPDPNVTEAQLEREWDALQQKYTMDELVHFDSEFREAHDMFILGSEVEDKQGLAAAQRRFYNNAERQMDRLPRDFLQHKENYFELHSEHFKIRR